MCQWADQDRQALAIEVTNMFRFDDPDLSTVVEQIVAFIETFER